MADAGLWTFTRAVKTETLIADSVIASSNSPGAGNIFQPARRPLDQPAGTKPADDSPSMRYFPFSNFRASTVGPGPLLKLSKRTW